MTIDELFDVQRDDNKLRSLYIELARHENFNPYKGNIISDMPRGGGAKNFSEWYVEEGDRIRREIDLYEKKLQRDRKKLDVYLESVPYPECDIIRFRAINSLSWKEIGDLVGYSGKQTARKFWDFIKDVRNVPDDQSKT